MSEARLKRTRESYGSSYGGRCDPDPPKQPEVPAHIKEWVNREIQAALQEAKNYATRKIDNHYIWDHLDNE